MAVFDKIKKIFAIDEEDLSISDLDTKENKDLLYQQELVKNQIVNEEIIFDSMAEDKDDDIFVAQEIKIDEIKPLETVKEQPPLANTNKLNLDFQDAIKSAYETGDTVKTEVAEETEIKKEKVPVSATVEKQHLKDTKDLSNKETYVPRDIISPMKGIIKKHTVEIPRKGEENKNVSSEIIKMRQFNKVVEVKDNKEDTLPFDLYEEDTKKLDVELNKLSTKPKSSLRDTSMFTLVEDSTGEMRLVIDEEE